MTTDVFIDLDRDEDRAPTDAPRPIGRPGRQQIRAVVLSLIALLLLLLPALSVRPRPQITQLGLFPRPAVGYQNLRLLGDTVIAIADGAVTAFELDGTKRWSYRSEGPVEYMYVEEAPRHGTFLLATVIVTSDTGLRRQLSVGRTIALDRQTGQPRWQVDDGARPVGELIVSSDKESLRVYQGDPPMPRWQADGLASSAVDPAGKHAWTLAADGTLSERDLATGEVLRQLGLGVTGILFVLGGRVFLISETGDTVAVLDATTLQRAEWPGGWIPSDGCGPVICASARSQPPGAMGAVDRQTGRLLWTTSADQFMRHSRVGLLALRFGSGTSMTSVTGVIDPQTGQVRVPLTGWNLVDLDGDILVRTDQDRLHIARLEPGGPRVLGSVPHPSTSCVSTDGEVLLCDLSKGGVGVWRLAP